MVFCHCNGLEFFATCHFRWHFWIVMMTSWWWKLWSHCSDEYLEPVDFGTIFSAVLQFAEFWLLVLYATMQWLLHLLGLVFRMPCLKVNVAISFFERFPMYSWFSYLQWSHKFCHSDIVLNATLSGNNPNLTFWWHYFLRSLQWQMSQILLLCF